MTACIDLHAEATDEQRQNFRRAFKLRGGKRMFLFVKADAGVTAEALETFVSTVRERHGDDVHVTILSPDSTLSLEQLQTLVESLIALIRPSQV
jgi:hypothetical protein